MGCFEKCTTPLSAQTADRSKHVNYIDGMILGVDEFRQEFAYLSGRDEWVMRDAIGYGAICGLRVSLEKSDTDVRIVVDRGNAISPSGTMIHVPVRQCSAWLGEWLKEKSKAKEFLEQFSGSPPSAFECSLYVTLSYRDCPVDDVPIPGAPCRTEEDSTAPSRIVDGFLLELRLTKPIQREEDGVRGFAKWLKTSVDVTNDNDPQALTKEQFEGALRVSFGLSVTGVPLPWDMPASPPDPLIVIAGSDYREFLRVALRFWVTEVRPLFRAKGLWNNGAASCDGCSGAPASDEIDDDCLLLAEARLPLLCNEMNATWIIDYDALNGPLYEAIDESQRPILVSMRMLQELGGMDSAPDKGIVGESAPRQEFSIAAAARILHDGAKLVVDNPAFNSVRATIIKGAPGTTKPLWVSLTFPDYHKPDSTFNYSVRVLESVHGIAAAIISVRFDRYSDEGIELRISKGSAVIQASDIDFMIEVARYSAIE